MTTEDRAAIEKAVENWMAAWERKDVHLAVQDYAEDADWTNVFGVWCRSRAELDATLTQIFSSPFAWPGVTAWLVRRSDSFAPMWRW
jgi:uncharacterized protein (TIGR02246 family)